MEAVGLRFEAPTLVLRNTMGITLARRTRVQRAHAMSQRGCLDQPGFLQLHCLSQADFAGMAAISICGKAHIRRQQRLKRKIARHQHHTNVRLAADPCQYISEQVAKDLAAEVKCDFKSLTPKAHHGMKLVYFDNGATSQKPRCVLDAMQQYYESAANVHRGLHALAEQATEAFEMARRSVARFVNAASQDEIVFTSGATEAINLVANTWGIANLHEGDEVLLTCMEHHSNIVPWQLLAQRTGATLRFAGITPTGELDVEQLESLVTPRTRLISMAHVSNVLGCINPVQRVVEAAQKAGAVVLLDACQSVPHMPVDVQALGVDFLVASGHKMCGPTGIGFLWGREQVLRSMPPWKGGGEMIKVVTLAESTYADIPQRFEAGTPAIAEAVGLGAACSYLMDIGMARIAAYEADLARHLWKSLASIPGLKLYGPAPENGRAALVAFTDTEPDVYAVDLALLLDEEGFAIRAGHHCAQPLHSILGAEFGTARASLAFYNTHEEVDAFAVAVRESLEMLRAGEGCIFDPKDPDACSCASERMRS